MLAVPLPLFHATAPAVHIEGGNSMAVFNPMLHHDDSEWSGGQPEPYEYHARRKGVVIWVSFLVLLAVLGALIYYGYRTAKIQNLHITQVFGNQGALTTLGQRADAAEGKLHDLAGDWQSTSQRITALETKVAGNARATRAYAESLTQQLRQQMTSEMDSRTASLDSRLRQVESEEANQRAQMAQMQASLKQDLAAAQEENGRNLSGVRQQEEANARGVNSLSERLDRRRIDFELAKGQTKELMPGVSLQIRGVNQKQQHYHGSLWLQQDQRTVWLRDASAQQPVRFFHTSGGEP